MSSPKAQKVLETGMQTPWSSQSRTAHPRPQLEMGWVADLTQRAISHYWLTLSTRSLKLPNQTPWYRSPSRLYSTQLYPNLTGRVKRHSMLRLTVGAKMVFFFSSVLDISSMYKLITYHQATFSSSVPALSGHSENH